MISLTKNRGKGIFKLNKRWYSRKSKERNKMKWYGWGSCDQGQLGQGTMKQTEINPIPLETINSLGVSRMSVGMNHSLYIVDKLDDLYVHGYNIEGQLGVGDYVDRDVPTPAIERTLKKPLVAVAGPLISFVITDDKNTRKRELWKAGLTVIDKHSYHSDTNFVKVDLGNYSDAVIENAFCGQYFNLLLDDKGRLFSSGYSETGGLGIGSPSRKEPGLVPIDLKENESIKDISVGWGHVVLLTDQGRVFSWGASSHGQCGLNNRDNVSHPTLVDYFETNKIKVRKIATGSTHSLAIDNIGNLYVWGSHHDGKLGLPVSHDILEPTLLAEIPGSIVNIAAGCDNSLVLNSQGELYSWGFGQHGVLGLGSLKTSRSPQQVPKFTNGTIQALYCGMDISVVGVIEE